MTVLTETDINLASIAITALDVANSRAVFLAQSQHVHLNEKDVLNLADEINTWVLEKIKENRSNV